MRTLIGVYNTLTRKYENVEVSDEVYIAYTRSGWNIDDSNSSFYKHEIQISSLVGDDDANYENFHELSSVGIEQIKTAIISLSPDEQMLIRALFFEGVSEREYASRLGIPQRTLNNRKLKLLSKLRKFINF